MNHFDFKSSSITKSHVSFPYKLEVLLHVLMLVFEKPVTHDVKPSEEIPSAQNWFS